MAVEKVLITGASGYIAAQILPEFRGRYSTVLLDVTANNPDGGDVQDVIPIDLTDSDRSKYAQYLEGVDAVVHLSHIRRRSDSMDSFFYENANVIMAYNVFRTAYEAGVNRIVMASSNHAADWYEHALIHQRKMEMLDPYKLPLSDNFYGWAKATYEHLGFVFASGGLGFQDIMGKEDHVRGLHERRKIGVVMVRIGAPRELDVNEYNGDIANYKRDLGAYISPRDLVQLFTKALEAPNIQNEYGIPWQVVYGISNNTRAFWSLANARNILGYQPEDDSEVKYADDISSFLSSDGSDLGSGRLGPI